jgi:hypothetical protein
MRRLPLLCVPFLLCAMSFSSGSTAQDKEALAEALYKSALDLMEQGKNEEACPKLKQSHEIDPAVGTLLYLGLCYERLGKPASAWAAYRAAGEASRKANQPERREIALERAAKIEPTLSTLTLLMPPEARVPGLQILIDGAPVGTASLGVPMPVDPGQHVVEVIAPGHDTSSQNVVVDPNGATHTLNLRALAAVQPSGSVATPAAPSPTSHDDRHDTGAGLSTQQTVGLVVGGVGVLGLAAGTYFGIRTQSAESEAKKHCTNYPTDCSPTGLDANEDAKTFSRYATAGFLVGGAALIGGAVVYLTAPEEATNSASVRISPAMNQAGGSVWVSGSF